MQKMRTFGLALIQSSIIAGICASAPGADNLVKNGNFADGTNGWDIGAADPGREITVLDVDGQKAIKLTRKTAETAVAATQYNIPLKHETLYRLSFESKGDAVGVFTFRPQTSKDPNYFPVAKSHETSS